MIKKSIYPKTKRISKEKQKVVITEKLDGSNLCFFRLNNELYIAQRNNIISLSEIEIDEVKKMLYSGLYGWLKENGNTLLTRMRENAVLCGEWIAMGKLKYPDKLHTFNMFAKANIDDSFALFNIYYDHELFIYPFEQQTIEEQAIPEFINVVPVVYKQSTYPSVEELNNLYEDYTKLVDRNVEGFVVEYLGQIKKYVRMKNGKLTEHKEKGE